LFNFEFNKNQKLSPAKISFFYLNVNKKNVFPQLLLYNDATFLNLIGLAKLLSLTDQSQKIY